jgi:predicted amidohydrolase YtcJ
MIPFGPLLTLAAPLLAAPSLILHNGRVWVEPGVEAQAISIEGSRVGAVGSDADVLKYASPATRVVDLKGRAVLPGFHDSHVHFMKGALGLLYPDLNGALSVADVQKRARDWMAAHPDKQWVLGRGWDHTAFADKKYPTKADLDAVTSTQPVVFTHVDGHMLWLNSEALRRAGIKPGSKDPDGAKVIRGPDGEPTGVIEKEKSDLLKGVEPEPDPATIYAALEVGIKHASRWGVTSIQGPLDVSPDNQLAQWLLLTREGKANIRYFIWGPLDRQEELSRWSVKYKDLPADRFRFGGLKGFVDGVLSNYTGYLLEPYADSPTARGRANFDLDRLTELVETADAHGLQSVLHAVGDGAVRTALDACEAAQRKSKRHLYACKIEHIEVVSPADIPRFAKLRVVASMQPSHMTYDDESGNYNPARLGPDRIKHAFAWKELEQSGALLVFGTDWPVVPLEPRLELFAATTREHMNGKPDGGWIPEQKVSLVSAIQHYTLDPAKAIGRERELGTLEAGMLADLVVLDRDLFATSGLDLLKVETDMTVFNGLVVYERAPQ